MWLDSLLSGMSYVTFSAGLNSEHRGGISISGMLSCTTSSAGRATELVRE